MKVQKYILISVLLFCGGVANVYADPNCEYCESTPKYIQVTLSGITPFNGGCDIYGNCSITSPSINGTYILEWMEDANFPWCGWFYDDHDPNIISTRNQGEYPDVVTSVATGLRVCVIRERYSYNTMDVYACSAGVGESGFAYYFLETEAPIEFGCVGNQQIANGIVNCYCAVWMNMPPWTAGLGGTITIKESRTNFAAFTEFANDWLNGSVGFGDLDDFLDEWLVGSE